MNYKPIAPTAVYHIATNSWTAGPDLPSHGALGGEGAGDTWSSLLPNGNVLVQTNPPGITDDPVARANARYASIRNGTAHLISAEAEGRGADVSANLDLEALRVRRHEPHPRTGGVYV